MTIMNRLIHLAINGFNNLIEFPHNLVSKTSNEFKTINFITSMMCKPKNY